MDDQEVLSIVCSNNPDVLKLLDAMGRDPADSKRWVGATVSELRELVKTHNPDVAIFDAELADGSGYELCREVRDDGTLSKTNVILIQRGPLDEKAAAAAESSRCDDIVSLPIHSDDFYCHISQFTSVRLRAGQRVAVDMEVVLTRDGKTLTGSVLNMTSNGLGIQLEESIGLGPIGIGLRYHGETYDGIQGKVIWCRENPTEKFHQVGLNFGQVPPATRALLVKLSLFQVSPNQSGDGLTVALQGGFDERTDFAPLLEQIKGAKNIDFMMQRVSYLSSCGVRSWCLFIEALDPAVTYSFRNCSLAFASQAAMVPMSIGAGTVISVQAPYFCDPCDREESRLVESVLVHRTDGSLKAPPVHCHICKKTLVFDDIPQRYFAFLGD